MEVNQIKNQVREQGYSIFKLAPETIKYLRSMDLSNLEDGFHVNNAKHCAAVSEVAELNNIIFSLKKDCISEKTAWNMINVVRVVKQKALKNIELTTTLTCILWLFRFKLQMKKIF